MKDLTKGNIYKTFLLFAIPMVLAGVLSQCYSLVNTILAGQLLGDGSLAAIGALSPLETFLNSFFWGYGTGVGIFVGHLFGGGKYLRLKQVVIGNFLLMAAVVVVLSLAMVLLRYPIYAFLQVDPQILPECNRYFIISTLGRVVVLFAICCMYVVNALGDSAFPLCMSLISTVLNILLGVVFITRLGMGVEGLALGNVVSSVVVGSLYWIKLIACFQKLGLKGQSMCLNFGAVRDTWRYAVPVMVQQSIMYLAGLVLSPMVNGLGSAASASYTVSLRIYELNTTIYQNSAKTVGAYTAQCFGGEKYHLLKRGLRVGFVQNLLFVAPVILACSMFARPVAMLFFAEDALAVSIDYTVAFARYCIPLLGFNIVANLFHNYFRGVGYMKALVITTVVGSLTRIVISWIGIQPFGIYGYYAGWVLSWLFDGAACVLIYFFGRWRHTLLQPKKA